MYACGTCFRGGWRGEVGAVASPLVRARGERERGDRGVVGWRGAVETLEPWDDDEAGLHGP